MKEIIMDEFVSSRDESLINEVLHKLYPECVIDWRDNQTVWILDKNEE